MELTLDQALQKGIEAHRAGKAQEADRYYTAILKANPKHPDANHNMGVLAVGIGKVQEALPFLKKALDANPKISRFWLTYINALIKLNLISDAQAAFHQARIIGASGDGFRNLERLLRTYSVKVKDKKAMEGLKKLSGKAASSLKNSQNPPQTQLQALINMHSQGQLQEALEQCKTLIQQHPSSAIVFNIKGAVLKGLGHLDLSVEAYTKALSIEPNYAEAHNNIGNALKVQGKLGEAIEAYNRALFIKPDYAEAYNNLGNALKDQGKLGEAIEAYNKALSLNTDYHEAHSNIGNALTDQGKLREAIEAYSKALSINPDYAEAYYNMGGALKDQGKLEEAIKAYKKAISLKPDFADTYYNMGVTLHQQGKLNEAIEAYIKALAIKPDFAEAHRNLSTIKKYTKTNEQFFTVKELYRREDLSGDARCSLSFALAKMYEDIGELDEAFTHLSEGNALRKKLLKYSINQDQELFTNLKRTQPHLQKSSPKIKESSTDPSPVFILGMPRSGTTLVEQIISAHSEVIGAGELNYIELFSFKLATETAHITALAISEFREKYLSELSKLSDSKQFVTDKMPQNFRFIPLICAAFPKAKIVHLQRNTTATCWSNYKQYFVSDGLGYCYDLKDVVEYYNLYRDLMKLWQSQYGDRIYNLNYESLTTDQENQTRKLIKYLDLNWEDACLSPHKNKRRVTTASQQQVRQKVYQGSSEAWRKYEPYLNGAFDSLQSS